MWVSEGVSKGVSKGVNEGVSERRSVNAPACVVPPSSQHQGRPQRDGAVNSKPNEIQSKAQSKAQSAKHVNQNNISLVCSCFDNRRMQCAVQSSGDTFMKNKALSTSASLSVSWNLRNGSSPL